MAEIADQPSDYSFPVFVIESLFITGSLFSTCIFQTDSNPELGFGNWATSGESLQTFIPKALFFKFGFNFSIINRSS